MNIIKRLIDFFIPSKNGTNKFYDECVDLFNIKILKGESAENYYNFAYCNVFDHCMFIRKPSKEIDNYIDYSIDIINHEFMHYLLYRLFDEYISSDYHEIYDKVEFRKMFTDSKIAISLQYK